MYIEIQGNNLQLNTIKGCLTNYDVATEDDSTNSHSIIVHSDFKTMIERAFRLYGYSYYTIYAPDKEYWKLRDLD